MKNLEHLDLVALDAAELQEVQGGLIPLGWGIYLGVKGALTVVAVVAAAISSCD
jgi:lactobin A/cerein 7B family class IIb bacteriocin